EINLGGEPTTDRFIIDDPGIRNAQTGEVDSRRRPEGAVGYILHVGSGDLVIDRKPAINELDEMRRADRAIGVRWRFEYIRIEPARGEILADLDRACPAGFAPKEAENGKEGSARKVCDARRVRYQKTTCRASRIG